ncbi:MAG: hypothetical protein H7A35_02345 [Planctomycetales bacterium]|nr:hypothetical protein [bacterium]UNM08900.1 MAG: hypothetical protein H7A35_02345 [Planctomycetales bacterium]
MRQMREFSLLLLGLLLLAAPAAAAQEEGVVIEEKNLVMLRHDNLESIAFRGDNYSDFQFDEDELTASFVVSGPLLGLGSERVMGKGIRQISWEPAREGTLVSLKFASEPQWHVLNAMGGTELRPNVPQVLASFSYDPEEFRPRTVLGKRHRRSDEEIARDKMHGDYELPGFPDSEYSDARVTLKVVNGDFREILWYMSQIGNVSIVLDPYWGDEPTGAKRPPGGGVDPGTDPGDGFVPGLIRNGVGQLTLNFDNVPFSEALDLILMSVGLVKVDIY